MEALVWKGDRELEIEEIAEPDVARNGIVLDVELAGICGSDLHGYRGNPGPRVPPLVLGHEAVGSVEGRAGRFVVFPLSACGKCDACARGESELCDERGLLGMDRAGVFAERVAVSEEQLVPLPPAVDPRAGALVEPLATGVAALRREGAGPGQRIAVIGCGPVGLLAVYAAHSYGLEVCAVEPLARRRAVAERLGADACMADASDMPAGLYDVVLDCAGFEGTWTAAIDAARSGGSVVLIGLGDATGALPAATLVRRGVTLRGHFAYGREDFDQSLRLLVQNPLPLDWIDVLPLEDGAEGFRRLTDDPDDQAKILLAPQR